MGSRRVFMLAIDAMTFDPGVSHGLSTAAQQFVRSLPDDDLVGLFTYPLGPKIDPTTNHETILHALEQVTGQGAPTALGGFRILASDVVDYTAAAGAGRDVRDIIAHYCPGVRSGSPVTDCRRQVEREIETEAQAFEAEARANLGTLRTLVDTLGRVPGRKILVLASAGLPLSDRPGGRPDVGDLPMQLGEAAARGNIAIYALYLDHRLLEQYSAETAHSGKASANMSRDSDVAVRWLDQFAGSAGGALIKVMVDNGEQAFTRIVRETSAYYLLGVEPTAADRTGRPLRVRVKVAGHGLTVRSREWVVVPKRDE
jgi:VWFA-related protein